MLEFKVNGFPELIIRNLSELKKQLTPLLQKSEHLFEYNESKAEDVLIELRTKREFYFVLFQPEKQTGSQNYIIRFNVKPHQTHTLSGFKGNVTPLKIIDEFIKWIGLINSYEEALNQLQNPFDEKSENEINELFNFLPEENDDVETFDIPTILMLEQILDKTSEQIREKTNVDNPEIQLILEQIQEIKNEAPNKPRAVIKKRLSKVFSSMKKNAWPAFKWLLQETIKEVIKETIKGNLPLIGAMNPFK